MLRKSRPLRMLSLAFVFFFSGLGAQGLVLEEGAALELQYEAFSPNSDGFQDTLRIELDDLPGSLRECADWRMDISGPGGVRSFVADRREIRAARSITNLFLPGSTTLAPIRVFEEIVWDGRGNNGRVLLDGTYQIAVRITHKETRQVHQVGPVAVQLATRPPRVSLSAPVAILVRPQDEEGNVYEDENKIMIAQSLIGGSGWRFVGSFLDEDGDEVETKEWEGSMPAQIEWNGRGGVGRADYGVYSYRLDVEDGAGNRARFEIADLMIVPRRPVVDLHGDSYRLSPDGNRDQDFLRLEPTRLNGYSSKPGGFFGSGYQIVAWRFGIYDSKGDETPVFGQSGQGGLPRQFTWDGRNDAGAALSNGLYFAHLAVETSVGDFETVWKPVRLDNRHASMGFGVAGHRISPDGDDSDETQRISLSADDVSGIRSWALYIYVAPETKGVERRLLRVYRGQHFVPPRFYWNGAGDNGETVESNERLAFEFEAIDGAGNIAVAATKYRTTDVLFRPTEPGGVDLESNLPMRDYFDESNFLTGKGRSVSRRIRSKLARYKRYFVHLEVHAALPGTEEENMIKTEGRADYLYNYWKEGMGYPRERMDYRGFGETEPLGGERADPFSNYRNARIRIYLTPREDLER